MTSSQPLEDEVDQGLQVGDVVYPLGPQLGNLPQELWQACGDGVTQPLLHPAPNPHILAVVKTQAVPCQFDKLAVEPFLEPAHNQLRLICTPRVPGAHG